MNLIEISVHFETQQVCLVTRETVVLLDPLDHRDLQATKDRQEWKEKWE